jgi:hypothetical protein
MKIGVGPGNAGDKIGEAKVQAALAKIALSGDNPEYDYVKPAFRLDGKQSGRATASWRRAIHCSWMFIPRIQRASAVIWFLYPSRFRELPS